MEQSHMSSPNSYTVEQMINWLMSDARHSDEQTLFHHADMARAIAAHLRSGSQPEKGDGWQLMGTAPKDGTEFLAWRKDAGVMLVRWTAPVDFLSERELGDLDEEAAHEEGWFYSDFVSGDRLDGDMVPTHWQPVPQSPATSNTERKS